MGFWHSLGNWGINWEANTDEILYKDENGINSLTLEVTREYQEDVTGKYCPQFPYKPNHCEDTDVDDGRFFLSAKVDLKNQFGWELSTGVARIDFSAAHAINVSWNQAYGQQRAGIIQGKVLSGDIIEIKGRRRTVANVAPIFLRDLGDRTVGTKRRQLQHGEEIHGPFIMQTKFKSLTAKQKKAKRFIRMDHFIRENAGVKIGNSVAVKKIEDWIMADTARIMPMSRNSIQVMREMQYGDEQYFAGALENQPFIPGQNFMIPYSRGVLYFQIISATPNAGPSGCYRVTAETVFSILEEGQEWKDRAM